MRWSAPCPRRGSAGSLASHRRGNAGTFILTVRRRTGCGARRARSTRWRRSGRKRSPRHGGPSAPRASCSSNVSTPKLDAVDEVVDAAYAEQVARAKIALQAPGRRADELVEPRLVGAKRAADRRRRSPAVRRQPASSRPRRPRVRTGRILQTSDLEGPAGSRQARQWVSERRARRWLRGGVVNLGRPRRACTCSKMSAMSEAEPGLHPLIDVWGLMKRSLALDVGKLQPTPCSSIHRMRPILSWAVSAHRP